MSLFAKMSSGRPIDALRKEFPGRWRYDPRRYAWRRSDGAVARFVADLSIDEDVKPAYRRLVVTFPIKHGLAFHTICLA